MPNAVCYKNKKREKKFLKLNYAATTKKKVKREKIAEVVIKRH